MSYPSILNDVLSLNSRVPTVESLCSTMKPLVDNHNNLLTGKSNIQNTMKFQLGGSAIIITNPQVETNKNQINVSGTWSNTGIVARDMNGSSTGQLVLGRQYTVESGSAVLGNCILEHYNGTSWASLVCGHYTDGTTFANTNATTPSKTDSSTNIATTKWVKSCIPLTLHAYGYWNKTALSKSYNCSMAEENPGQFRVTFHSPTADSYYMVAVSGEYGGAGTELFGVYSNTTTGFAMDVRDYNGKAPAISTGIIRFFVWA